MIDCDTRAASEGTFFIDVLRSQDKNRVLDVGTGAEFYSVRLLDAGFDVTSADGAATKLARVFEYGKAQGHRLKTVLTGAGMGSPHESVLMRWFAWKIPLLTGMKGLTGGVCSPSSMPHWSPTAFS